MFAIIEDGARQYRVQYGDTLTIDYRADCEAGQTVRFEKVLLAAAGDRSSIGRPVIEGASVEAEVIQPLVKGKKLEIQKIRRRKNSRTHTGHRQKHTAVRITGIHVPGFEELAAAAAASVEAATPPSQTAAEPSDQPPQAEPTTSDSAETPTAGESPAEGGESATE